MKSFRNLFLFCFLMCATQLVAQQQAQYSQYMFNSLVINPAYAGYREALNANILYRDQWTGFQGAPKTQTFNIDGAFFNNENVGLGLSVINDKAGLQGQTSAYFNYAYRLPVGEDARLAFGLGVGVEQYTLNGNDAVIEDMSDPNFTAGNQSYFSPDAKFGIHYSDDKFYAAASATSLFSARNNPQPGKTNILKQNRHYFITAGYLTDLNDALKFKPSIMLREDTKGPTNVDVNAFLLINETLWLGGSYRTGVNLWKKTGLNNQPINQNSMVASVQFIVASKFRIGYAYDYSLSKLSNYANGSHEISVGMTLDKRITALLTPRYF